MGVITDQWTGNGLSEGTTITSGNVATAGNFSGTAATWTATTLGTPTFQTFEDGFAAVVASGDQAHVDATLSASVTALRQQFVFSAPSSTAGTWEVLRLRNTSSQTASHLRYDGTSRTFVLRDQNNSADFGTSPAITADDEITIDVVFALSAVPATSNGRFFYRLTNNTDPNWNTVGFFFYDSLYTRNLQTANFSGVWWGKSGTTVTVSSPGVKLQFLGAEGITVNPADVTEQYASAYFADNPSAPYGLETGAVTAMVAGYRLG